MDKSPDPCDNETSGTTPSFDDVLEQIRPFTAASSPQGTSAFSSSLKNYLMSSAQRPHSVRERTRGNRNIGWLPPSLTQQTARTAARRSRTSSLARDSFLCAAGADDCPIPARPSSAVAGELDWAVRPRQPPRDASLPAIDEESSREPSPAAVPVVQERARIRPVSSRYREGPAAVRVPRYRRIEDLTHFVLVGPDTEETAYFRDAMERRIEKDSRDVNAPKHSVVDATKTDPRFAQWRQEQTQSSKEQAWVSARARRCLETLASTTGEVKPYALGRPYRVSRMSNNTVIGESMETYIATMQCERPTKGVFTPY